MPHVNIMEGLRLRFPGRDPAFSVGVEVGMLATLMAIPVPRFSRLVSPEAADHAAPLAAKLGYRIEATEAGADPEGNRLVEVTLRLGLEAPSPRPRPALRLVAG